MRVRLMLTLASLLLAGCTIAEEPADERTALAVGDPAPAFSLVGSDGRTYSLSDYAGKQAVVIAWFPKAFTGG